MNIEEFREYCLSLGGVTDKMPFGKAASEFDRNLLVFYVLDKWFCLVNIYEFGYCIIRCAPDDIGELQARYDEVQPAYHMNKKHWINVYFNRSLSDETVLRMVKASYDIAVATLTKKQRESLRELQEEM